MLRQPIPKPMLVIFLVFALLSLATLVMAALAGRWNGALQPALAAGDVVFVGFAARDLVTGRLHSVQVYLLIAMAVMAAAWIGRLYSAGGATGPYDVAITSAVVVWTGWLAFDLWSRRNRR